MAILKVKNGSQWVDIPSIIGPPGPEGSPGISPAVAITDITDGHRVTITDATGPHSFDVLNGIDGQTGPAGKDGKDGIDGSPGTHGVDGTTFTPSVSAEGVISWTNDGGKPNPQPMNIKGPHGADGTSPTVSVADISGGHRVTVTDANGTRSFDVMDGDDYVLTAADKAEIAQQAAEEVDVPVQDVQVNGVSVLQDGVANVRAMNGIGVGHNGGASYLQIATASLDAVKRQVGSTGYQPLTVFNQHAAAFYGLAKAAGSDEKNSTLPVGQYTESAKSAISTMLSGPVTVSGTTPSIIALSGIQYICGEVSTLDITLPASGCVDVVFQSGSTPTVLTVTPPTGVTVKWPDWFDATSLEANRTYEISFADGFGAVMSWT